MRTSLIVNETTQALKRFGKSVCIITSADQRGRFAAPSSAITNLTNNPPTLLLPMEKTASLYPLLSEGARFGVNLLAPNHQPVIQACITKEGEDRFSVGRWQQHALGVPVLVDAQAVFVCDFEQLSEYGSHGMIIGKVVAVDYAENVQALIYIDNSLRSI